MAIIHFSTPGMQKTVKIDVEPDDQPTLLSVAKEFGVPVLFNCETGGCGACVVDVETKAVGQHSVAPLENDESFLLEAMGKLSEEEIAAAEEEGVPAPVRLACQYRLGDEEIVVSFETRVAFR
ncbi:MAG: (2Fe-2S)-binding protein [Rhodospirillales bacterium]|nr:(2Fe-2S)-binding protein [Rhodospirillales bacterium]